MHCYKRILDSINFASREAAFLARSLQVLLSTWNPARRIQGKTEFEIGKKMPRSNAWIYFVPWEFTRPAQVSDVLRSYFGGLTFPSSAADILIRDFTADWRHPTTDKILPACCKIVIYRDLCRASKTEPEADLGRLGFPANLLAEEIVQQFALLKDFFQDALFAETRGGAQGSWWQQQLKYLRHFRQRPVHVPGGPGLGKMKPGSQNAPAGGDAFSRSLDLQSAPIVVNGC